MFKEIPVSWNEFKSEVTSRTLIPQFRVQDQDYYDVFANDGIMLFTCLLTKGSDDSNDFEANFKDLWNKPQFQRTDTGLTRFHVSPRPEGYTTYFTGASDSEAVAGGDELIFNMTAGDSEKSMDITFNEDVWFKDGQIWSSKTTPTGALFNVEIIHPIAGAMASLTKKVFLLKDWLQPFDTEDSGLIQQGLIIRITIKNATGTGEHEAPADFTVIGRLEMYRKITV